jgi:hypothetical protein
MYEADFRASKESANSQFNMIGRLYQSPGWIVTIALIIRLVIAISLIEDQFSPKRDHFSFGWETGRIARSVALGEGFSSPLHGPTGPTALMPPIYVYLVAAVFKVFGVYTLKSAVVILTLNSLLSTLTCLTVFFIANKSFGREIALRAGWMWALYPYAIDFAACRVWAYCLDTLLFSLLFLVALHLEDMTSGRYDKPQSLAGIWTVSWASLPGLSAGYLPRREYSTQSRKAWVEMRGALVATLLFDVLPQYFDSRPACTNQAVGAMPEYRLPVDAAQMLSELLADEPGRDSFQVVDQIAQLNRQVRLKKQVDVISFAIELD